MSSKFSRLHCPTFFGTSVGQTWDKSGQALPVSLIFLGQVGTLSQKSYGTETPCLTQSKTLSPCPIFSVPIFGRDRVVAPCLSQSERVPRSVGTKPPCLTQSESGRLCPTAIRDSVEGACAPFRRFLVGHLFKALGERRFIGNLEAIERGLAASD